MPIPFAARLPPSVSSVPKFPIRSVQGPNKKHFDGIVTYETDNILGTYKIKPVL